MEHGGNITKERILEIKEETDSLVKKKAHKIHDNFFSEFMSDIDLAREFLEKFLDKEVVDKIDMSSL